MKKGIFVVALVAILALASLPFVYAQGHGHGRGMHGGSLGGAMFLGHLEHAKAALDLSDAQVTQIKAIAADLHTQNAASRQQVHGNMGAIVKTLLADPNNLAAAQAQLDAQAAAEKTLKSNTLAAAAKAIGVLTPEQRTKLGAMIDEHMTRAQQR
jgi:Spy/CpxP family protein refolding chaperone